MLINIKDVKPDMAAISEIGENAFYTLPLLRKKIFRMDFLQAEHDIPLSHVQVLILLEERESMTVSEISREFGIAKPNITPLVDRLIDAGLADRERSTTDRRVVNVVIKEEGRKKLQEIQKSIDKHVSDWTSDLSPEDKIELSNALKTFIRILKDL